MTISIRLDVVESIADVPPAEWNALVGGDDFYQSHEWLCAVERDSTARPRYLLATYDGHAAGALSLYRIKFEGSPLYRLDRLRALLGVDGEYLVAGARRCYRSGILLDPRLPEPVAREVIRALLAAGLDEAARTGLSGLSLFYLPTAALERIGEVAAVTAGFDAAEATVDGVGDGMDAFLNRQSGKRRAKIRRELRTFAASGWHTSLTRLGHCLSEATSLVGRVERRHGQATPDVLLRRVFRRQVQAADEYSVVYTCRNDEGTMLACSLNYRWRDAIYSRAVGLDYDRIGHSFAYFNLLLYRPIEYAGQHGIDRLYLGLASSAKLERGAVARPLFSAVVPLGALDGGAGVRLTDPGAMQSWSEPLRCYEHAFTAESWTLPRGGSDSSVASAG